jgi:hypothetical protein
LIDRNTPVGEIHMNRNKTARIIARGVAAVGIALTLLIGVYSPVDHGGSSVWVVDTQL